MLPRNARPGLARAEREQRARARCSHCGEVRAVCCGDGPGTPYREVSCAKCCGPHPRHVVRHQNESASPD